MRSAEHGFTSSTRSAEHGFTLVEMMISLLIFGLLAAAGVALLAFSVRAQGMTDARLSDVAALNRLGSALSADLAQAQNRPARDQAGDLLPAFVGAGGSGETPMLRFVRAGWTNLDEERRPSEQKVAYQLANGTLQRIAWPELDGARPLPLADIVTGIARIDLRYRYQGAWTDHWDGTPDQPMPDALEMDLTRTDGVQFRELFMVGTGYGNGQETGNAAAAS